VAVYAGSYDNLKVTTPEDLAMATALLAGGA
jgi:2-C-methyl-D-erythritol 4-phosphate cytidylyltransferase